MRQHLSIVDVFGELICCPFLFAIQFCKAKLTDRVAVKSSLRPVDYRVMTVNPYCPVVMRDRESKDSAPVSVSHIRTVLSYVADASRRPSGEKATELTYDVWPSSVCKHRL
jgi:hypothetical protein